jgi:hypothetical protein
MALFQAQIEGTGGLQRSAAICIPFMISFLIKNGPEAVGIAPARPYSNGYDEPAATDRTGR